MNVMNWNDKTYFLGTDSLKIGFVQGKMITDYLAKTDPAKAEDTTVIDQYGHELDADAPLHEGMTITFKTEE